MRTHSAVTFPNSSSMYRRYEDLLDQHPVVFGGHCASGMCMCQLYNTAAWGDFGVDERYDHSEFTMHAVFEHLPEDELRAAASTMLNYMYRVGLPVWDQGHHFNMYGVFEAAAAQLVSGPRANVEYFLGSCHDEAIDNSYSFLPAALQGEIPDTPVGRLGDAINAAIHSANARGAGISLDHILSVLGCHVYN